MRVILMLFVLMNCFVTTKAQSTQIVEGLPTDLNTEKIIFLKQETIKVTADKNGDKAEKYLYLRQTNHNNVVEEANQKFVAAAMEYPFQYAIATESTYRPLLKAGYRYVIDSKVYDYDHLRKQPNADELIVFEYYIVDTKENKAYKAFEIDEMKVYSAKVYFNKLKRLLKDVYPNEINQ